MTEESTSEVAVPATERGGCPHAFPLPRNLDVHPEYTRLRDAGEIARYEMPFGGWTWLVTSYADVRAVLSDARFSRAAVVGTDTPRWSPVFQKEPNLLTMDPPQHTGLRGLLARAFTPGRIETLRPQVQAIADALLDELIEQGPPADLIRDFALPLPITVICELLGVPQAEREQFGQWSDVVSAITAYPVDDVLAARAEIRTYLTKQIKLRREQPHDDLLGVLVSARDHEGRLSEDELVGIALLLLVAGHETTANLVGNCVHTLLAHPDRLAQLRAVPERIPAAIDELLRFIPFHYHAGLPRIALEDVQLGGTTIKAGDAVVFQSATANRDGTVFDHPEELDFDRPYRVSLTFGFGPHRCLGAHLAKMELEVAIGSILARLPGIEAAVPLAEVEFKLDRLSRGPVSFPITWQQTGVTR